MSTDLEKTKLVAGFVAGHCVKAVATTAIATLVPVETKKDKVKIWIGTYVIGSMLVDASDAWIDKKIDALAESFEKVKAAYESYK